MNTPKPNLEEFSRRVIAGLPDSLSVRRNDLEVLVRVLPAGCRGRSVAREMLVGLDLSDTAQREFCFEEDAA